MHAGRRGSESCLKVDLYSAAEHRARRSDPETSHAAAAQLSSAEAHCGAILGALADGEATIYQIASRTGLNHVQVARRLPELKADGKAVPTGQTAAAPTGRQCRVWRKC